MSRDSAASATQDILERLSGATRSGSGWAAHCPNCDDPQKNSKHLTVSEAEDGRTLLNCHKGCDFREIMAALDLEPRDAFPRPVNENGVRQFHVRDASGNKVATHHRKDEAGKKKVWWTTEKGSGLGGLKGSSLPLWGSEAIGSIPKDEPLIVTEGEKAAFYLTHRGIPALGSVTGASGTPGEEALAPLAGRTVVLWPDADEEGRAHMQRIADALEGIAEVRVYEWPEAPNKGDAADHPAVRRNDAEGLRTLKAELAAAPAHRKPRDRNTASSFEFLRQDFLKWIAGTDEDITGIRTGLPEVDKNILGLNPGRSYIIAAAPGQGKSLLCGQIALTAAYQGKRVLLHSIESSAMEYAQRMTTYMAGVDYFRAIRRKISHAEKNLLFEQFEKLCDMPFMVTDLGTQKPSFIRAEVERHKPDLVVVDYLQYATPDDPTGNAVQDLDNLSRQITSIKGDYNVPVLLAAQINRERVAGEPQLHHLRGSGALEQDADVVMFLHRPTDDPDGATKLLCRKNRIAKLFNAELAFVPGQQWFTDQTRVSNAGAPGYYASEEL